MTVVNVSTGPRPDRRRGARGDGAGRCPDDECGNEPNADDLASRRQRAAGGARARRGGGPALDG